MHPLHLALVWRSKRKYGGKGQCLWFLLASWALMGTAQAQPSMEAGKAIASQTCVACHGADGNTSVAGSAKLAGQIPEYLAKAIADFQAGDRTNAMMQPMVANLSPQDRQNVAAYFSAQTLVPASAADEAKARAGEKIYKGGIAERGVPACMGCHGPQGEGIAVQFPRIGGQVPEYTAVQLNAFRDGKRKGDPQAMMQEIAQRLTPYHIDALSQYIAGLR